MKLFHSILLIVIILNVIFSKQKDLITLNKISEITVTINGNGKQNILREPSVIPLPDEMIVNGSPKSPVYSYVENLDQLVNTITMRWNNPLTDCSNMFDIPTNIIEIDLTNFDTSQVTKMICMFCGLPLLQSLDLSSLDTSSTLDMSYMFEGCQYLTSLDLST